MTRVLAMLLAVMAVLTGVAGCATRAPSGTAGSPTGDVASPAAHGPASSAASAANVTPSVSSSMSIMVMPAGGPNPEATIPDPGTGPGNPLLAGALLPLSAPRRLAAMLLSPGIVALPDRDLRSVFIGLRQYGSPVVGPRACDGWTAGLSAVVLSSFNQPGVQLAVERGMETPAFAETIITGPPPVLAALTDPPLPAACRDITTPHYSGGVQPIAATVPGAVSARAFEVTGTGKVPVWMWAEVIQGRGFLLEIRIPIQSSASPDPEQALTEAATNAYQRAATVLASQGG
ncbi:MAG: hypothetical protein QOH87_3170 [Trebonia sp.]|nr:hypothetical protein [Trebonia sp.]